MPPVLHDAVTLRHFAAVDALDVLRAQHGRHPEPHRQSRNAAYFN